MVERLLIAGFVLYNQSSLHDLNIKNKATEFLNSAAQLLCGEPAGARTRDPNIKSVVLYLLSYGFIITKGDNPVFGGANV